MKEEIENLKKTNVENVKKWMQVNDDVHAEKEHELAEKDKEIERLQETLRKSEEEKAALKAEKQAALEEKYKALSDLKEANEKLAVLLAKYNKDYRVDRRLTPPAPLQILRAAFPHTAPHKA